MQILRADVGGRRITIEPVPEAWTKLGGRGLCVKILLQEMDPSTDPMGSEAKLIWAPGLLTGYGVSSCDRISLGGKSPLTGGIKESNAGGITGAHLVGLGGKALILQGEPEERTWSLMELAPQGGRIVPVEELEDKGAYERAHILRQRYGDQAAIIMIGPAAEMGLLAAGVLNVDQEGRPSRINARGGLGAVMASKKVRAIIIPHVGRSAELNDRERFLNARKEYTKALMAHPQTEVYADYGTAAMTQMTQRLGALPTRNFRQGSFEGADEISGESLRDMLLKRSEPSLTTHACMPGCAIRCSNVVGDSQGEEMVSPLEYETIALLGSNLGIADLDAIARLNWRCNDLGLDTIEIGAALGVAAEAGKWVFGDHQAAAALLEQIAQGTPLGRALGSGAVATGQALGVERVPAAKGQAMAAYDPRAVKGTGVTYATSPQGADHTAGLTIRAQVDHRSPEGQVEQSRKAQRNMAGYDTLGACLFAGFGVAKASNSLAKMVSSIYGGEVEPDILVKLGEETLRLERAFNMAAGLTAEHDRLPGWMEEEPLPPTGSVFDVPHDELDRIWYEDD